jgi:preprotein translocase subunit YajC
MRLFVIFLQSGGLGGLAGFFPIILMFLAFYFLIILPQRRRQKELQELINNLKVGDRVITSGGIIGTIASMKDQSLIIKSGEKAMLEISRSSVTGKHTEEEKS